MTFEKTFRRGDAVFATVGLRTFRGEFVRLGREGYLVTVVDDPQIEGARCYVVDDAHLRHAPVEIVGPRPAQPPTTCPSCGSALQRTVAERVVETNGRRRKREVAVVACSGCEFVEEIKH